MFSGAVLMVEAGAAGIGSTAVESVVLVSVLDFCSLLPQAARNNKKAAAETRRRLTKADIIIDFSYEGNNPETELAI
jgi:hypothetical protein